MKSLTRTASILHKILRDHEIKEDVSVKAHRKNEWGIDPSKIIIGILEENSWET